MQNLTKVSITARKIKKIIQTKQGKKKKFARDFGFALISLFFILRP